MFSLEPIGLNSDNSLINGYTYSWIHLDVRAFDKKYLSDDFFCKNILELNKEKLVMMAQKLALS